MNRRKFAKQIGMAAVAITGGVGLATLTRLEEVPVNIVGFNSCTFRGGFDRTRIVKVGKLRPVSDGFVACDFVVECSKRESAVVFEPNAISRCLNNVAGSATRAIQQYYNG